MKKLSDYKGDEAIELWADLLEPLSAIIIDDKVKEAIQSKKSRLETAKVILSTHKKEAVEILQRIDPEPIDGLNVVVRLIALLADIGQHEEISSFFGYAEQAKSEDNASGFATANTGAGKK